MRLSREIPETIDVLEYLLPKLKMMTVEPEYEGDNREPKERFIEILEELSMNTEKAEALILRVDDWTARVEKEKTLMIKRADGYIELYATNYNHYYRETKNYKTQVSRVFSIICNVYNEFTDTSKREKYKHYDANWKRKSHSLFDSSPLNSPNVQTALFGLETYPQPHQILFVKLHTLLLKLEDLFEYATQIDNMVENLRKNHKRIIEIFNKCKQKTEKDLEYILNAINCHDLENHFPELVKDLRTMSFEDFIVKYYHELNIAEFNYIVPLYNMVLKETYGINTEEAKLYDSVLDINDKIERVKKLRAIMGHLDTFDLKGRKVSGREEYHVSSSFIAMLMKRVKIPPLRQNAFVEYFTNHYHGNLVPAKYAAVEKAFNNIDENSDEYKDFNSKAQKIEDASEDLKDQGIKKKVAVLPNKDVQISFWDRLFT